jgi:hypothetical protein
VAYPELYCSRNLAGRNIQYSSRKIQYRPDMTNRTNKTKTVEGLLSLWLAAAC